MINRPKVGVVQKFITKIGAMGNPLFSIMSGRYEAMDQTKINPIMKKKRKREIEWRLGEIPGYAKREYPPEEDIYRRNEKLFFIGEGSDANIDDVKTENPLTGEGLDVPGAELDDASEEIGAEDEENNYYSLGGDNHS